MFGIRTWRALRRRGVMGINQRNGAYVLAYNDRRLYPLVDDKIRTKKVALDPGIQVPDMYGIIDTEQGISKLQHIVETHGDFVIKPAQGAGGDGIMVIFNDPFPCDDPAGDALRLALAMREKMVEICLHWKRLGHRLGFGVGISPGVQFHTGDSQFF